jgi:hypothetical protein
VTMLSVTINGHQTPRGRERGDPGRSRSLSVLVFVVCNACAQRSCFADAESQKERYMDFAAMHESKIGTKCECRLVPVTAAPRGEAAGTVAVR